MGELRLDNTRERWDARKMISLENESSHQQMEGESSADESDSETTAYQSNRDLLLQTAEQVFSDAAQEFSQLSSLKERIERRNNSSTYRDAYMSLSVPAIFSPYVTLELLKWDPLYEEADFDELLGPSRYLELHVMLYAVFFWWVQAFIAFQLWFI